MDASFTGALLLATALTTAPVPATTSSAPTHAFDVSLAAAPASEPLAYQPSPMVSRLALMAGGITAPREPRPERTEKGKKAKKQRAAETNEGLGPERARILLRSLTVPGWGQATLGRRGSAKVFLLAEAGVWGAFTAFRIQQALRTDAYLRTARLAAGIDLRDKDDEFRRIVGAFAS